MARPTRDDALVMIELAQWHSQAGVAEALNWVRSDEFVTDYSGFNTRHPAGSEGRLRTMKVFYFYETVGTLYKHNLFSEELLFDWLDVAPVWNRMKGVGVGMRESVGSPRLWENFEALANAQVAGGRRTQKRTTRASRPARAGTAKKAARTKKAARPTKAAKKTTRRR